MVLDFGLNVWDVRRFLKAPIICLIGAERYFVIFTHAKYI